MRAILMFQWDVMDKVTRLSTNHNLFEEKGRRAEAVSNRGPSAYQPNALPLGQTADDDDELMLNVLSCQLTY